MRKYLILALVAVTAVVMGVFPATTLASDSPHPENVTICHAAGLDGTTHYETLTIGYEAVYGPAGHFYENGTPQAGHEQDYLGACNEPPPPTDVCPNLEGDQATVPEGYHLEDDENGRPICVQDETEDIPVTAGVTFIEATCTTGPSVQLLKTNPGLRFYNVEGPIVDGHLVAGATYTFTALVDEGYVVVGQSVFTHTFAAAPTNCGTSTVTGAASVFCDSGAKLYRITGTVDGQAADKVTPATLPGNTKGVTEVVVTRGDTSVRTTVVTLGDCDTTVPPVPAATPPTAPPAVVAPPVTNPKPKAKPKTKPVVKPKPKAKPKAKPKKKPNKKPQKAPKTLSL